MGLLLTSHIWDVCQDFLLCRFFAWVRGRSKPSARYPCYLLKQVRSLQQQNALLETEIEAYQNRFQKPSGLRLLYEEQLKEMKRVADQMKVQRVRPDDIT